jgi:hypothetical protein
MMPNHSYYQGAALESQTVKQAFNKDLDMVCVDCGADRGKCYHANETDYCLETREGYEATTDFIRRTLYCLSVVFVVSVILLVSFAVR